MHADLFCKRVDNYGDVGVCWRLARSLQREAGWRIRLWIDDLAALAHLAPQTSPGAARQVVEGIEIIRWTADAPALTPGDVVIETFACEPPPAFRAAMRARVPQPVWVNLEYLSAEAWVEGCHGLSSPQPDGLLRHFFFPGFTLATGGLLRESGLSAQRDAWQGDRAAQRAFLQRIGAAGGFDAGSAALRDWDAGARLLTLFCYPAAPVDALAAALAGAARPVLMVVPEGIAPALPAGQTGALHVIRVPFLPQGDYDRLLWSADLNFVRGEDSFLRAAWAARPLVWQIYPQEEGAHWVKLDAWLARYQAPEAAQALIRAWNAAPGAAGAGLPATGLPATGLPATGLPGAGSPGAAFAPLLRGALRGAPWEAWEQTARAWDARYAAREGLAANLARFCAERAETR